MDRNALGKQTADALKDLRLENLQTFTDIFDVKELADLKPDRETKSVSSETTFPEDLRDLNEIKKQLNDLSVEVAQTLERKHLLARTVSIKVRYENFHTVTRSHTAQGATNSARSIFVRAKILLERTDAGRRPVRLLGVGTHGLQAAD